MTRGGEVVKSSERLDIHLYLHDERSGPTSADRKLDQILALLTKGFRHMAGELKALEDQVKANTDVEESALALINGIADRIAAAAADPAKLQALSNELKASSDKLAAAVTANTPAAA
jgi:hypothetical protein